MTVFERICKVVDAWSASLLTEGYVLSFRSVGVLLVFYKFRHSVNGNSIVIKAYPKDNFYIWLKNGRQVKAGKIIESGEKKVHKY